MDTNETTIYTAILITGIVIGTIFGYFTITIFRSHRKHFKLLSRHFVAEIDLLEKERTRIAGDLHDELGPILAMTRIHINATQALNDEQKLHLGKAEENIGTLSERFSSIAKNLTPKILVTKGLEAALEDFIQQFQDVSPISIKLQYQLKSNINILHALHIYRMMQELIHNGIKHSCASVLQIQIKERKNKIYLFYVDDGKGIHTGDHSNGLGLQSLKNRTEMLGGKMSYSTNEKQGTEYLFEIPLKPTYETKSENSNRR